MHHFRLLILFLVVMLLGASAFLTYQNHPEVGDFFLAQVGSVGISVGVLPNGYNTLAQQLADKEQELNAREAQLNGQTAAVQSGRSEADTKTLDFSAYGEAALLALVFFNFYVDYRARKKLNASQQQNPSNS